MDNTEDSDINSLYELSPKFTRDLRHQLDNLRVLNL